MHFFVGTASPLALVSKKNSLLGRFLSFLVSLIWISVTLQIKPLERRDKIDFGESPSISNNRREQLSYFSGHFSKALSSYLCVFLA